MIPRATDPMYCVTHRLLTTYDDLDKLVFLLVLKEFYSKKMKEKNVNKTFKKLLMHLNILLFEEVSL